MNKQIIKFAEQAGSTHKQNLGVYQFYTDELEKFARLIVEECAEVLSRVPGGSDSTLYYNHSRALKEHFGVESKNQLICPKCGVDRFRVDCPNPNRLDCGIKMEAQ